MLIRCEVCRGGKKMLSFGNIIKECEKCKGVGMVENAVIDLPSQTKVEEIESYLAEQKEEVKAKKLPLPKAKKRA